MMTTATVSARAVSALGDLGVSDFERANDGVVTTSNFSSTGDMFRVDMRGSSNTQPFAVLDDSLTIFTPDTLGIIKDADTDPYFGVVDTANSDNPTGNSTATWTFDISDGGNLTDVKIDFAAMGDFESSDLLTVTASIDGGAAIELFDLTPDEAASQAYTLEGGAVVTLSDPMTIDSNGDGTADATLNNDFSTHVSSALAGLTGSSLELTISARTDGGSEAIALRNIEIMQEPGAVVVGAAVTDGADVNLAAAFTANAMFGSTGDMFRIDQRGGANTLPFAVLDDSLSIFTPDSQGIIKEADTAPFFGNVDNNNTDNPGGGATATFVFEINDATLTDVTVDLAAMGDFESTDSGKFFASIDGGPQIELFSIDTDEAGSQSYTLEGGNTFSLNDPKTVDVDQDGTADGTLNNEFTTFTSAALNGMTGDVLTITYEATSDGGSEATAFRNLTIEGTPSTDVTLAAAVTDGADVNLTSATTSNAMFGSTGDMFRIDQRGGANTLPFAVLDDSLSIFTPDSLGIIKEADTAPFFGNVDNNNTNNPGGGATATFTFDIDGGTIDDVRIDLAAMGDFEANDVGTFFGSVDGGAQIELFSLFADEAATQDYTLEGGGTFTLGDPMVIDTNADGVADAVLTNNFATFKSEALSGLSGDTLTITYEATSDGGAEAVAFRNINVDGTPSSLVTIGAAVTDGADVNLTSATTSNAMFGSTGDMFRIDQRGGANTLPFAVLDDSLSIFTPDSQGIIKEADTAPFFGNVDNNNTNNPGGGATATFTFDIGGATIDNVEVDLAAMGDFESTDFGTFFASIDGGAQIELFSLTTDEAATQDYTLEGGATFSLDDPMVVDVDNDDVADGVLTNEFTTYKSTALAGMAGNTLVITYEATSDGGSEAVAFRNLIVEGSGDGGGGPVDPPLPNIVINEVDTDTTGTDAAEFIELFDGGTGNTSLDGLSLVLYNGSDDASYDAIDLDGFSTDADGYFVVGSASVPNVDLVEFTTNGVQNGADAVALVQGDASDFPTDTPVADLDLSKLLDAVVYDTNDADDSALLSALGETTQYNEDADGNKDNDSLSRVPNGTGEFAPLTPTPGAENVEVIAPTTVKIHEVQGSGTASPLVGQVVTVTAIVTADLQDGNVSGDINGFFLQEEDADQDADANTSEGIFVFDGFNPAVDVQVGDTVTVTGTVTEFFGETQITASSVTVDASGGAVTPVVIDLPSFGTVLNSDGALINDLESLEGMLIKIEDDLTVGDTFNLGRYGEFGASVGGGLTTFTQNNAPDVAGFTAFIEDAAARSILIDDGFNVQNKPFSEYAPGSVFTDPTFNSLDTIPEITGVLDFGRASGGSGDETFRIIATQPIAFDDTNPREVAPASVGEDAEVKVGAFNVLNFFNGDGMGGGFPTARGAGNAAELARQTDKLVEAISTLDADVLGLIEIENDGYGPESAIQELVDALNAEVGAGTYDFVDPGVPTIGSDAIAVGFIYKPAVVTPTGSAILDETIDPRFDTTVQRPALAVTFESLADGESFTAVNNHLKSKGSIANGDAGIGDGAGNNDNVREDAANALVDWLATDPTGSGDPDVVILGDLNSYAQEDPIQAILDGSDDTRGTSDDFTNLVEDYSFGFPVSLDGAAVPTAFGQLDYALGSESLTAQVTGATIWHINADEPRVRDYNDFNQVDAFVDDAFRASDHDPVLIGLNLDSGAPVLPKVFTAGFSNTFTNDAELICDERTTSTIINAGGGDDIVFTNSAISIVNAGEGDDEVNGGPGRNILNGEGGNDTLLGNAGRDTLNGGADNDILQGGMGQDSFTGGTGADAFIFDVGEVEGFERITDFDVSEDLLLFYEGASFTVTQGSAGAVVGVDGGFLLLDGLTVEEAEMALGITPDPLLI